MQFKTDENLPIEVAARLRSEGYDALSVLEQGLGGASDQRLMETCRGEVARLAANICTLFVTFSWKKAVRYGHF